MSGRLKAVEKYTLKHLLPLPHKSTRLNFATVHLSTLETPLKMFGEPDAGRPLNGHTHPILGRKSPLRRPNHHYNGGAVLPLFKA